MKTNHNLLYYPNDQLLVKAELISEINQELFDLLDDMKEIMIQNKGMGLASTQLGSNKNCFIMKEIKSREIKEFINPIILEENGLQYEQEGCLSFPLVFLQLKRPQELVFTAQDRIGERKTYIVTNLEAICCSHELDHLKGELFINKVNRQQRKQAQKLLKMNK